MLHRCYVLAESVNHPFIQVQMHGSKEKQKERKEETRKQGKMDTHVETNTWYMGPTSLLEFWMFQNKFGPHLCVCTITRNSKLS